MHELTHLKFHCIKSLYFIVQNHFFAAQICGKIIHQMLLQITSFSFHTVRSKAVIKAMKLIKGLLEVLFCSGSNIVCLNWIFSNFFNLSHEEGADTLYNNTGSSLEIKSNLCLLNYIHVVTSLLDHVSGTIIFSTYTRITFYIRCYNEDDVRGGVIRQLMF